ncbi:hypothetical protein NP233_g10541 [Leucocoprinus birnbaumii]|uniref:Cytochrome P450 n=1 Tax=Leucocoprinus birnbaumii TaxID=56174 RepID=A0AAD5YPR5_9AGAR|nr:hypothetical protein NP233_g10541 [Leucocoprinus birnbaumii]
MWITRLPTGIVPEKSALSSSLKPHSLMLLMASSLDSASLAVCGLGLFLAWQLYDVYRGDRENPRRLPLPPGPRGYPIIDNLFDFPFEKPWLVYNEWFKTYGDMVYFRVFGRDFLVLGSSVRTYDLLEKRSTIYSDRPRVAMVNDIIGFDWAFTVLPYGNAWRIHRRTFTEFFHPNVIPTYHPVLTSSSRGLLCDLLQSPENFREHIRFSFGNTIMRVCYGIAPQRQNDPFLSLATETMRSVAIAGNPGSFLVDLLPVMKYIPAWFPGAGWKRQGLAWARVVDQFVNNPWDYVKNQTAEGTASPCIATNLMERLPDVGAIDRPDAEQVARNVCAVTYAGAIDTSVSAVQTFFMAMCLYPEVQSRAHTELDSVLAGRFPEHADRSNLPFINAIIKETMRWQMPTPVGSPHVLSKADEYDGFYIPKGTIVLGNAWTILHDPNVYPEPMRYNPDRFMKNGQLNSEVQDPLAVFGYGRRVCPGSHFSDASMFIMIAHILSVYKIQPSLDEKGNEVKIIPDMTSGILSYPVEFQCRIIPRSKEAESLIRSLAD